MSPSQQPTRPFSTSARVHPSYLPYMTTAAASRGPKSLKWVPPLAGLVAVGYGVATYRETQLEKHLARSAVMEREEQDRRRKNDALADAYGDRSNLAELEQAMRVYETQRGQ